MSIDVAFTRMTFPSLRDGAGDRVESEARTRGHSAGYIQGLRAATIEADRRQLVREAEHAEAARVAMQRLESTIATLAAATRALEQRTVPVISDAQDVLASAALDIAEAVVGHELADHSGSARSALVRALTEVDTTLVQVVRLNPTDLAGLDDTVRAAAGVTFVADPTLSRGDAVTEFADGYLDARIATAVDRVRSALLGES